MTIARRARLVKQDSQTGAGAQVAAVEPDTPAEEPPAWDAGGELSVELARAKSVDNLSEALQQLGWSAGGAHALARACLRPDDVRRRLAAPAELRVPGGKMLIVESAVFSHGVSVYPTNLRELGTRHYALGMATSAGGRSPIADPATNPEHACELLLDAEDQDQLSERLRTSEAWLRRRNPLAGDVAAEGVLQPLTLVGMRVDHRNGAPSVHLLTAADGSSRTTAAHQILEADPADLVYGIGASDRLFRQHIGTSLRHLRETGWSGLDDDEQRRMRAIVMPARLVIGYRPEPGRGTGFAAGVRSLVGMMHLAPPLAYGAEVERDAIAEAVLDALRQPHQGRPARITDREARWYAATITSKQARAWGLSPHLDVRAADITRALLHGGRRTTLRVNAGVRSITARSSPTAEERVAMAVELILRPWRTAHADDEQLNLTARRSAMQRAYAMPDIARQPDEPILEGFPNSVYTLEDLRDQALNEARDGRGRRRDLSLGSAQVELATKAGYYLILADPMGLRREAPPSSRRDGVPVDQRSPSAVLTAMLSTRRGVQQAYAIVINGRKGETLWEVNEDGTYRRSTAGEFIALTDEKIRATYGGRSTRKKELLGLAAVEEAWQDLAETIDTLDRATQTLAAVRSASGRRYLDEEGWPEGEVKPIRDRIERVLHKLRSWEYRWLERQDDLEG